MKIALICTPRDVHARKWASALAQAGAEVIFCCPKPEADSIPGCRIIPVPGINPRRWNYADFWLSAPALRKILQHEKPDIVQALHVTPFGVWARLAGYRPLTLMALGADILEYSSGKTRDTRWTSEWNRSAFREKLSFLWHRHQVRKTIRAADQIWTDNQVLQQELIRLAPGAAPKTDVFTWGIDVPRWDWRNTDERQALRKELGLPANKIIILCPRGLKPVYQAERILNLIESDGSESPLFWVVMKGNYPIPKGIQENIQTLSEKNALIISETLPESRVVSLFQASDACLSLPVYDGLSASLLQAMACGLDLFVSDIPATRELEQSGVHLTCLPAEMPGKEIRDIIVNWYTKTPHETHHKIRQENRHWVEERGNLPRQTRAFLETLSHFPFLPGRPIPPDRMR